MLPTGELAAVWFCGALEPVLSFCICCIVLGAAALYHFTHCQAVVCAANNPCPLRALSANPCQYVQTRCTGSGLPAAK
jgi:hypothetical protein